MLQLFFDAIFLFDLADRFQQIIHLDSQFDLFLNNSQHRFGQLVGTDGVLCAGAGIHFLKCRANVITVVFVRLRNQLFIHSSPAIGAAQEAGEQVKVLFPGCRTRIALQEFLNQFKGFLGNDGLVGVLDTDPVFFRYGACDLHFITDDFVASLHHDPGVYFVTENAANRTVRPQTVQFIVGGMVIFHSLQAFVSRGIGDAQ